MLRHYSNAFLTETEGNKMQTTRTTNWKFIRQNNIYFFKSEAPQHVSNLFHTSLQKGF